MDRLNIDEWASSGNLFRPPDDTADLFALFERADLATEQQFLEAAKAYQISHIVWHAAPTGSIAYLVVAAESLLEDALPVCPKCKQRSGIGKATRNLFLRELPCLSENEAEVTALLNRAYKTKSCLQDQISTLSRRAVPRGRTERVAYARHIVA